MASKNSSVILGLSDPTLDKVLTTMSSLSLCGCLVAVVTKLIFFKVFPSAWKYCLLCQDVAYFLLSLGLLLVSCHGGETSGNTCKAGGFFIVVGVLDIVSSFALTGIAFLLIQNPTKMSQLSTFRWKLYLSFVIPPKVLSIVLAVLPVSSLDYFDTDSPYSVACFPVRQEGKKGAAFGAILIFTIWGLMSLAVTLCVVLGVRFWAGPGTRVHASTPSLWQTQKIEQCKSLHKFSMLEQALMMVVMLIVVVVVYTNNGHRPTPQWIALLSLAAVGLVHVVLAMVQLFMWSSLCCDKTGQKKEPHHRLKQLELIRTEGPGKLRLKVTWAAGKAIWKRGLLKVYGPAHIKAWAQEIVVLGLLRKSRSASVLQCLWTSNTNPYHEAMTLISGVIVTGDSRLTCLELTSSGTLKELLKTMEVPIADSCQRTIMRDVATGLSCLHDMNVLHRNLTSSAVYLKGSVQRLMLRAAIGDFEDAQIYGTILTGSVNGTISKKRFFFPDVRSYALVGIEMLARVCECRRRERQLHCTTSIKTSSSSEGTTELLGRMLPNADQNKHQLPHDRSGNGNGTELVSEATDDLPNEVKRFDKPELLYCAPGEPEYGFNVQEPFTIDQHVDHSIYAPKSYKHSERKTKNGINHSDSVTSTQPASEEFNNELYLEHNIDNNWKLQSRAKNANNEEATDQDWSDTGEDSQMEECNVSGDVSRVRKSFSFTFPNYSIFRGLESGSRIEELDMIEEDIDLGQKKKFNFQNGQHAGYVTSVTNDGREIFIPAAYKQKKSGENSSSGYGSSSGSTTLQTDQYSSSGTVKRSSYKASVSHTKRFQITSPFEMTGSVEDDILEILPAVGDNEYKSRKLFTELKKAKEDARTEQLMASYEERVKKGEPSDTVQYLVAGIADPRNNSKQSHDMIPDFDTLTSQTSPYYVDEKQENDQSTKVSKERQNDTFLAERQNINKLQPQQKQKLESKINNTSSFHEWTAKSSLRRNKARLSLKKAFLEKRFRGTHQLSLFNESRGLKGKEVEQKYSSRHGQPSSRVPEQNSWATNVISADTPIETALDLNVGLLAQPNTSTCNSQMLHVDSNDDKNNKHINHFVIPPVQRNPSVKTRHAPQPPLVVFANHNNTSSIGVTKFATFDNSQSRCSSNHGDGSFTSVEPASTESEYTIQSNVHQQTSIDKIESDMNDIIQSNLSFVQSNSVVSLGLRLIDSGLDSDSVTSNESCVCAAAALQIPEEGSFSDPSEIFSQSRCSCACSNCLGSIQGLIKESSWPDSPDSETLNNSNSFSSYDNNMHRRKLPRRRDKEDPTACILAPDDQYPSSTHHANPQSSKTLHLLRAYSLERRQRRLSNSVEHYTSSASETSSAASRHYRELIKKGVPLRVSVISGENNSTINNQENLAHKADATSMTHEVMTHTAAHGEATDNLKESISLYNNLKGNATCNKEEHHRHRFAKNTQTIPTLHSQEMKGQGEDQEDLCRELSPIPSLEEIIKEIPDETGHFPEETKTFLNRPDSELSIKAMKEVLSRHDSALDRESKQLSELMIDSIFSQAGLSNKERFKFPQSELDVNRSAFKDTMTSGASDSVLVATDGLVSGMDIRHVKYCRAISDGGSLVTMCELLPANLQTFDLLRSKLQQNGSVGLISSQIIDLIMMCWLDESPPTTASIVHHLADHVMETEL